MTRQTTINAAAPARNSAQAVAAAIAQAIHEHRLAPGTKLGEDELSDIYGVSRTIIRAALQSLAHEQLVLIQRNRGAFVSEPTPKDAKEVFEARELLEPRMALSAAQNATDQGVAILRAHIANEHAAIAVGEPGRALSLSGQFHIDIARMAGHDTIADFITTLIARSSLIIALYARRQSALCESHAHDALVDAIAARDGILARDLMQSHLVDLHSALDLRAVVVQRASLRQALQNHLPAKTPD